MTFDAFNQSLRPITEEPGEEVLRLWYQRLLEEAQRRKATLASQRRLAPQDLEELVRQVFAEVQESAWNQGVRLPDSWLARLLGDLSGLGSLLELVLDPRVEDIAVNYGYIYVFRTGEGWRCYGRTPSGFGEALRVLMDAHGARPPTPDLPIADATLQVALPVTIEGAPGTSQRVGLRINFIMPPASPHGDVVTIRVSRRQASLPEDPLGLMTARRLPPVQTPPFHPRPFPDGRGALTPEAANYILAVLYQGAPVVVAGATGTGKTFLATLLLQNVLRLFPRGALRLFIIEDTREIYLHDWDGDPEKDSGNVVYTLTRPSPVAGTGPPPITMYDLIRAALRSRPHGIVVGEARGPEAWELIRATATGHGYSVFSIHATGAEQVWPRFLQAVQAHPDVRHLTPLQVAQAFAEGVALVVFLVRHPQFGQVVETVAEVAPVVESQASRPAFHPIFVFDPEQDRLVPTGNRPMRPGLTERDLNLPSHFFVPRRLL